MSKCGFCRMETTKDDKLEYYCNNCRIYHAREEIEKAQKTLWELLPMEEKPKSEHTLKDRKDKIDLHSTNVEFCYAGKCDICNERKFKALFPGLIELIDSKLLRPEEPEDDNRVTLKLDYVMANELILWLNNIKFSWPVGEYILKRLEEAMSK